MPLFPSKEWCEEAARLANADPESVLAGEGWVGDFGVVIDSEPGKLEKAFAVHLVPVNGRVETLRVLADPDDLEEIDPVYLARGAYSIWKGLIDGSVDPVEAVLKKRLALKGDIQPLMERLRYRGIADRVLAKIQTQYIDEAR